MEIHEIGRFVKGEVGGDSPWIVPRRSKQIITTILDENEGVTDMNFFTMHKVRLFVSLYPREAEKTKRKALVHKKT
ncbi:MAG: hypothetical protein ACI4UT_02125 [Candidatus Enteromonas sp.]